MKIRIEIDVPEYVNGTQCHECPFKNKDKICSKVARKICDKVDFSRMEVKELEENHDTSRME